MRAALVTFLLLMPLSLHATSADDPAVKAKMSAFDGSGTDQTPTAVKAKAAKLLVAPATSKPTDGSDNNGAPTSCVPPNENGVVLLIRTSKIMNVGMVQLSTDTLKFVQARYIREDDAQNPMILPKDINTVVVGAAGSGAGDTLHVPSGTTLYSDHRYLLRSQARVVGCSRSGNSITYNLEGGQTFTLRR